MLFTCFSVAMFGRHEGKRTRRLQKATEGNPFWFQVSLAMFYFSLCLLFTGVVSYAAGAVCVLVGVDVAVERLALSIAASAMIGGISLIALNLAANFGTAFLGAVFRRRPRPDPAVRYRDAGGMAIRQIRQSAYEFRRQREAASKARESVGK